MSSERKIVEYKIVTAVTTKSLRNKCKRKLASWYSKLRRTQLIRLIDGDVYTQAMVKYE